MEDYVLLGFLMLVVDGFENALIETVKAIT